MDSPLARVMAVNDGRALLSFESLPICPRCEEGKGCGAGLLNGMTREREMEVSIPAGLELTCGENVAVELSDASVLRAAGLAYGLPLAMVLVPLALAWMVFGPLSDRVAVSIAVIGLGVGWYAGRTGLAAAGCLKQFQPRIVQRRGVSR